MDETDRNTIHGTAEISTGDRQELFSANVTSKLVNIICGGCGICFEDHFSWEEHIRDMVELEDTEHNFYTQVFDTEDKNVVLDGEFECTECGNGYNTALERDNHRLMLSTSVRLVCSQCASLVPDMELHLPTHQFDERCGECGVSVKDLRSHILTVHSGFMSVIILQTVRCAGDGSTLVSLEIVLATNARFLASEVKPYVPEPVSTKKILKRKLDESQPESSKKVCKTAPSEPAQKLKQTPGDTKKLLKSTLSSVKEEELKEVKEDPIFVGKKKKNKKSLVVERQMDVKDIFPNYDLSERDRALCPPAYLPTDFFDEQGNRVWSKSPTRKGLHQCELCGFNAKTKNKYREKQDHLMKWHFSKRIEKILPTLGKKPFYCPLCSFMGKDRQCVVRHYTGKHQALDVWMAEFLHAVTYRTLTEDVMNTVENVDIMPKPEDLQRPVRAKIVNTKEDLKVFLSDNYVENSNETYPCEECSESFPSKSALSSHRQIDHNYKKKCEQDKEAEDQAAELRSLRMKVFGDLKISEDFADDIAEEDTTEETEDKGNETNESSDKLLSLVDEEGGGMRCLTCSDTKVARLKSIAELKDHIQNNHMDLCRLQFFVQCQSEQSSSTDSNKFYYTLCSACGKCFSQNSNDAVLEQHRLEHQEDFSQGLDTVETEQEDSSIVEPDQEIAELRDEFLDSSEHESTEILPVEELSQQDKEIEDFLNEVANGETMAADQQKSTSRTTKCPCSNCRDPNYNPSGSRIHTCILDHDCGKTFTKVAHLKSHIRVQVNKRPFKCEVQGCERSFVRREEWIRHGWIHTGQARFKCKCGRGFGRSDHYRSHAVKCITAKAK